MSKRITFPREMRDIEKDQHKKGLGMLALGCQWRKTSLELMTWVPLGFLTVLHQLVQRVANGMSAENAVEEVFFVEVLLDDDHYLFSLDWLLNEYGGVPEAAGGNAIVFTLQNGKQNTLLFFRPTGEVCMESAFGLSLKLKTCKTRRDARQLMRALDYQV